MLMFPFLGMFPFREMFSRAACAERRAAQRSRADRAARTRSWRPWRRGTAEFEAQLTGVVAAGRPRETGPEVAAPKTAEDRGAQPGRPAGPAGRDEPPPVGSAG